MGIKKLLVQVKESFQLDKRQQNGKKESMERLLAKLRSKKETFKSMATESLGTKDLTEVKEDLAIITIQIKKGEHILKRLSV